jgi:Na+-driven multidrug efflux pump
MLVQNRIAAIEILSISRLGTDALAGIGAVSPLATLFIGITTVGMGGAVSSAVAQSLGAGKSSEADALAVHAIMLALVFGAISGAMLIGLGPQIYGALGQRANP